MTDLATIENAFRRRIPRAYAHYLSSAREALLHDRLLLYDADCIVGRNQTLGVQEFVDAFLAVGDDGGGRLIVIRFDDELATPYLIDGGALVPNMPPESLQRLAPSWEDWQSRGCPLE